MIAIAAQDFEALPRRPPASRAHRRELSNSEGRPRALGHCTSAHQLKRSLVFRLEFPQPGLDSREEMGIRTVRATQFGAFTRQTREAPCIHVEPRINQVAARGTYKPQHSHRYLHTIYCNQAACVFAKRCEGKISCETMPHHAALRLSRSALKFALPLSHPCSHCGFSRRFHSWPSTDGFMALIEDFRLESSSPEQKFVSQSPADADCLNLGSHKPRLTPAHDEKIARSTEQNAGRCDAESTKPHLSAPIGYEYESSSLSTLFSSCRARRRNDRRLR